MVYVQVAPPQCWPPLPPLPLAFNAGHQMLPLPSAINAGHQMALLPPLQAAVNVLVINAGHQCYLSLPSHGLPMLATHDTSHSSPHGLSLLATNATSLPSPHRLSMQATHDTSHFLPMGYQCMFHSFLSHRLSMLATIAACTSHSPPIGYQCWPPILPLTSLPLAINACYLSHSFHRLAMLAINTTSHSPPSG